ncbi:MAG: DUF4912 domain-containing protein [Myxococcales bacterium]
MAKALEPQPRRLPAPPSLPPLPPLPSNFDEQLGELPESYGDDSVVLLPKDPHTLYFYWDLSPATLDRAFAWMPGLRTRLRLLEGDRVVRDVDFSVGARGWYFYGLPSGHVFRVEMLALAEDGQVRRIGTRSNPARLPALGPSPVRDDRFVRIPLDLSPSRVAEALRHEIVQPPPLIPPGPPGSRAASASPARASTSGTAGPPSRTSAGGLTPAALPGRPRHAVPMAGPGRTPPFVGAPGIEALVHDVEPPPFTEAGRERIYLASGGAARPAGSSEAVLVPRGEG